MHSVLYRVQQHKTTTIQDILFILYNRH